jgi:hypothetical protein
MEEYTTTSPRPLKVFLCHSSGDKPAARELYRRLDEAGADPWLDEEDLIPGQEWASEIPRAVRASDVVVVCLSNASVNKAGYLQKELKYALDSADEQPEGTIFLIPLKLEECEVPERLSRWQWVNYFDAKGYERLILALQTRARAFGDVTVPLAAGRADAGAAVKDGAELPAALTPQEARRLLRAAPPEQLKELKELLSAYELHDAIGNSSDHKEVLRFAKKAFFNPALISKGDADMALEAGARGAEEVTGDDWSRDSERVRVALDPLLLILPSKTECIDRILNYPKGVVIPFLVKEYFSPDKLRSECTLLDLIEAGGFGKESLLTLEHAVKKWVDITFKHVCFQQAVRIARNDLGTSFEEWYKSQRGISYAEDLAQAEAAEREERARRAQNEHTNADAGKGNDLK